MVIVYRLLINHASLELNSAQIALLRFHDVLDDIFAKALLTPTRRPVRDLFATDFFATDWRSMRLVQPLHAHIKIEDYHRRLVGDR